MDGVELSRLPSAIAKTDEHFHRATIEKMDLFIRSIRNVNKSLLRILRKSYIPDRAISAGCWIQQVENGSWR